MNAVFHRDYAVDGMIAVEFTGNELSIVSPEAEYLKAAIFVLTHGKQKLFLPDLILLNLLSDKVWNPIS